MIRRNSNRWLFCLTWSYVKNLVTEVQNDRAKPFQAFFQQQQSLLCTFLLWADREVSEEVHQLLSLVSRHCFIADNGWRRKRMMAASSHKSHYQQQRERREINLFPITWEILFVAHKEILFDNQNKSSSTALLCSDLVVLQPFQPGNWKRLLKNRSMVNSNYCMVLQLFLFPIQIRN